MFTFPRFSCTEDWLFFPILSLPYIPTSHCSCAIPVHSPVSRDITTLCLSLIVYAWRRGISHGWCLTVKLHREVFPLPVHHSRLALLLALDVLIISPEIFPSLHSACCSVIKCSPMLTTYSTQAKIGPIMSLIKAKWLFLQHMLSHLSVNVSVKHHTIYLFYIYVP